MGRRNPYTKPSIQESFWVTNLTKMNVSLRDLNYDIPALSSVNLLDKRHHHLTKEQVINSATSGSLFLKRDKVIIRKVAPPKQPQTIIPFDREATLPTRQRSGVKIEHVKYDELEITDESYAEENMELAQEDHLGKYKNNKDKK